MRIQKIARVPAATRCASHMLVLGLLLGVWAGPAAAGENGVYGSFGPEGSRLREQLWIVPGADPAIPLRATLFRPSEPAGRPLPRRPLVVISHGTNAATREQVSAPIYYWLSSWFVERGYVVLLPQRRGHGGTGGPFAEGVDTCLAPDHYAAGQTAADDIAAAIAFMREQSFVDPEHIVAVGASSGGWASLALASRNPPGLKLVVNFAGGRGGHAFGQRHAVCGRDTLIAAAGRFAATAHVPTVWFYARNDSYFGPDLADALAEAWRAGGGRVDYALFGDLGSEGHLLPEMGDAMRLWGPALDRHLARAIEAPLDQVANQQGQP